MIRITGLLHRAELCALFRRWMLDQPSPTNAVELLRLVHFNNLFVSRYLALLGRDLLERYHGCPLSSRRASTKGELKDAIVAQCPCRTPRIDELMARYRQAPGRFFRETPFQGRLYFGGRGHQPHYVGSTRVKRMRRLAEKSARRLVDRLDTTLPQGARTGKGPRTKRRGPNSRNRNVPALGPLGGTCRFRPAATDFSVCRRSL